MGLFTPLIGRLTGKRPDLAELPEDALLTAPSAEALLNAVGQTVRLTSEAQMDAVTALSGSGPAYVFHLIEAMAAALTACVSETRFSSHSAKVQPAGR